MQFNKSIVQTRVESPLGTITIAASVHGLAGLWFEDQRHLPPELIGQPAWPVAADHPVLTQVSQQLAAYFLGESTTFNVPLDLACGTPFQQSVWLALQAIPSGGTLSYSEVSARIGKPAAVRAVGAAIGRNPISIIVPCHRVVGANGALTGYAGGLDRKTALLKLEGAFKESLL